MADDLNGERSALKYDPKTIGSTGLRQYGGLVNEEFLKELQGPKGIAAYREMSDNDPIVGAVIFAISMLLRQADWNWKAVDESDEAEAAKEFAESVFADMTTPLCDVIDEVTTMFIYGFAPLEIVWKRRNGEGRHADGKIGIKALSLRAQSTVSRWEIDPEDGTIDGLWQQPLSGPLVFIPIEKLLLFRTTTARNNPEGRSVLRTAYRPWKKKKQIEDIEGVGIERDLAGLPVARIPARFFSPDADQDEKAVFAGYEKLVRRIRMDQQQGILLPSDKDAQGNYLYDLTLMSSAGSRAVDTSKPIDRYDKAIATSVLADFIFLGQGAVGSFALSSDKTALFATAVGGFLTAVSNVFNRHLVTRLWTLNAFDPDLMPELRPGDVESVNLTELGGFLTNLASSGMPLFPDRELENHLRKTAGLPEGADDSAVDMDTPAMPIVGPQAAMMMAEHGATLAGNDADGDGVEDEEAGAKPGAKKAEAEEE